MAALAVAAPMLYVAGTMLLFEPVSWVVVIASLVPAGGIAVLVTNDNRLRTMITLWLTVGLSTVALCFWFLKILADFGD